MSRERPPVARPTLPVNLVILAQVIALALLGHNVPGHLKAPFLPFLPALDVFHGSAAYEWSLRGGLFAALVLILFRRCLRTACVLAATALWLHLFGSRAYYKNDLVFCAVMLLVVGLADGRGLLPRLQVSLVFLAACMNKLLDPDWWSGRFFEHWVEVGALTPYMEKTGYLWFPDLYGWLASQFPPLALARGLSWASMAAELSIGVGLWLPRTRRYSIGLAVTFVAGMVVLIGESFGVFFFALLAANLAFVRWPASPLVVTYDPRARLLPSIARFLRWARADVDMIVQEAPALHPTIREGFRLRIGDASWLGLEAIRRASWWAPRSYLVVAVVMIVPSFGFAVSWTAWGAGFVLRSFLILGLMAFLAPWPGVRRGGAAQPARWPSRTGAAGPSPS
jgi:hypothetical protein